MPTVAENNKRIAKNTLLLYFRMLLTMLVSLFTSRIVLNALGIEDYGINNVVSGVVAMFSILSNSLAVAISRFITYELGKKNSENLKHIFSTAVNILILISILICILSETIGVWFLNEEMNIPSERFIAANWVLQFSIFTFIINLISVPYNAAIIAHEKMSTFAYISIIEVTGKLLIAYLITISSIDRLILNAILIFILSLIIRIIYLEYCKRHFEECTYTFTLKKELFKQMFSFAGWNFIGASSGILRDQGINILLNLFCGTTVNAARGIAMQVNTAISQFINNFITAINPQIIKSYAARDTKYLMQLVFQGARFSFYLLYIISLPILMETPIILETWLKIVPDYTVIFVRLIIIYTMTEAISYTMVTLMLATGNIRNYQIIVGGCQMLNFPIAYIILKHGLSPEYTIVVSIVIAILCLFLRLYMLNKMVTFPIHDFLFKVVFNVCKVATLASLPSLLVIYYLPSGVERFIISCITCLIVSSITILFIGCSDKERSFVFEKTALLYNKYKFR